ncbi:MAG: undecaprenyldiphospho-muramoylpentapeptide beta-N-acetylglucosaminyltransferase [Nitrospirae bacterium]|nr:undecaprenyldiphospho-muramoylpentapeptide beta-N-acetylglucosaminyltransferase [Nitrospirota bacterium]MBI3593849.1 undecaprenyldiphospho-muramoylpentapeptide beta-N-acetylglucosaminyltransferase [Nitrospirota bacterium]
MRLLIAGGGTGGHLYPGIALAKAFQNQFSKCEILFVGTEKGIESRILPREGFALKTIHVEGWIGKKFWTLFRALFRFPFSLVESFRLLKEFAPGLVIGVGGYASGPILLVASFLGFKTVILEQNVIPGLTNKVLGRWVNQVFASFEGSRSFFPQKNFCYSGNPVRREILAIVEKKREDQATILVFGGSQGAHSINRAVVESLDYLDQSEKLLIRWIHQTGAQDLDWVRKAYHEKSFSAEVEPFIYNMAKAYAASDLVICRAGATTLAELAASGKPAILIPFPLAAHHHQEINASYLKKMGAAELIEPAGLSGKFLAEKIREILISGEKMKEMSDAMLALGKNDASEKIIERCLQLGLIHV